MYESSSAGPGSPKGQIWTIPHKNLTSTRYRKVGLRVLPLQNKNDVRTLGLRKTECWWLNLLFANT